MRLVFQSDNVAFGEQRPVMFRLIRAAALAVYVTWFASMMFSVMTLSELQKNDSN